MELFHSLMSAVIGFFKTDFNLFGYNISFWEILVFDVVIGIAFCSIRDILFPND